MTHISTDAVEGMLDLIRDEHFMAFVQESVRNYESKADFLAAPVPCNLDSDVAWELVSFVRRMEGWPPVRSQMPRAEKSLITDLAFQTIPPIAEAAINDLVARCDSHSHLWAALRLFVSRRRIIQPLADDLMAAAQREGIGAGYEAIRSLILGTMEPRTAGERVIAHTVALLEAMPHGEPMSPDLIRDVYAAIIGDVDLPPHDAPALPPTSMPNAFGLRQVSPEELYDELSEEDKWGVHPLPGIIMNSGIMWSNMSLGPGNAFLEIILRRNALYRANLPVLAHVPCSMLRLNWEHGASPELMEHFRYGEAFLISDFGLDCTPYLIQMLAMMRHYIEYLEGEVEALQTSDGKRRAAIEEDARLSHRQQELLTDMIADPAMRSDVGGYARRFDCATTTARDDLNRLVDLRYCSTAYQGKKQVFWLNLLD